MLQEYKIYKYGLINLVYFFIYSRGEVSAVVNQVTMKMQIKQMIQNSPPPELLGKKLSLNLQRI